MRPAVPRRVMLGQDRSLGGLAMSDTDQEQRIRERAYHLWEVEGRPEGRAEEHWRLACMMELGQESYLDEEGEESFPASDPPSHTPIRGEGRG